MLTKTVCQRLRKLPVISEERKDALAQVMFYLPHSFEEWYASEYDGDDTFFGLIASDFETRYGYFSLTELALHCDEDGNPTERDIHFVPTPLRVLEEEYKRALS